MRRALLLSLALACSREEVRVAPNKIEWTRAPAGDVAKEIVEERAKAQKKGRTLIVYVGASWCEPCQRFHHAVSDRKLDKEFPNLTFLEFDLDTDGERLKAAGYAPHYIPYFGLPAEDGRAGKSFEGSIKGEGAVDDLTPKLHDLLGQ